jgi:two-component system phosphate regulon response regulator OmpR
LPKPSIAPPQLRFGDLYYDPARDELRRGEEVQRLTDMEAGLMKLLAAEPGVALSREMLAERSTVAPSNTATISDRTVDVQVTRLRRKIEPDPKNPRYLVTVRGEGYMLMPDPD